MLNNATSGAFKIKIRVSELPWLIIFKERKSKNCKEIFEQVFLVNIQHHQPMCYQLCNADFLSLVLLWKFDNNF
jgi:hypothetical protein